MERALAAFASKGTVKRWPAPSTLVYKQAFQFFQISYASTISVVLFVIIAALSALQYLLGRDRVFYQ
jgi:ABC-type sugar transport system permease subunit